MKNQNKYTAAPFISGALFLAKSRKEKQKNNGQK